MFNNVVKITFAVAMVLHVHVLMYCAIGMGVPEVF